MACRKINVVMPHVRGSATRSTRKKEAEQGRAEKEGLIYSNSRRTLPRRCIFSVRVNLNRVALGQRGTHTHAGGGRLVDTPTLLFFSSTYSSLFLLSTVPPLLFLSRYSFTGLPNRNNNGLIVDVFFPRLSVRRLAFFSRRGGGLSGFFSTPPREAEGDSFDSTRALRNATSFF